MSELKITRMSDIQIRSPDFVTTSVAFGMRHNDLKFLDPKVKKKLIRLIARISEASYRRGVQQAIAMNVTAEIAQILRFDRSLDDSPRGEDAKPSEFSARERLFVEYQVLYEIGLELQ